MQIIKDIFTFLLGAVIVIFMMLYILSFVQSILVALVLLITVFLLFPGEKRRTAFIFALGMIAGAHEILYIFSSH